MSDEKLMCPECKSENIVDNFPSDSKYIPLMWRCMDCGKCFTRMKDLHYKGLAQTIINGNLREKQNNEQMS